MSGPLAAGASHDNATRSPSSSRPATLRRPARLRNALALIGWLALCYAAALLGAAATGSAPEFYRSLDRPAWAPGTAVFAPVWSLLYGLMAVAAWMVWLRRKEAYIGSAVVLFSVQLALNALWSWLFFGLRLGFFAFAEILVLWVAILLTVMAFARVRRAAGFLLVPYLAWVSFASVLTWAMWHRNAGLL